MPTVDCKLVNQNRDIAQNSTCVLYGSDGSTATGVFVYIENQYYILSSEHVVKDGLTWKIVFSANDKQTIQLITPKLFPLGNDTHCVAMRVTSLNSQIKARALDLIKSYGDCQETQIVFIIQHIGTDELMMSTGDIVKKENILLYYRADTDKGSEGSGVWNYKYQLTGIHHSDGTTSNIGTEILPILEKLNDISKC